MWNHYAALPDIYDPLFTHRALCDEWRCCGREARGKGEGEEEEEEEK